MLARGPRLARESWERFWSGAQAAPQETDAAVDASRLSQFSGVAALAPAAHNVHSVAAQVAPFAEGAAVLAAAIASQRGVRWLIGKIAAAKHWERHQVAALRFMATVVVWTGAAAAVLHVAGASGDTLTATFGGGGLLLTLALKDVLGNFLQGFNFLLSRPYTIGTRVEIDGETGVLSDITATGIVFSKDDGSKAKIRHSSLAAKPVSVYGAYQFPGVRLTLPHASRLSGFWPVLLRSIDRRFLLAAAGVVALTVLPGFVAALSVGWAATTVHYSLVAATLWLTRRVDIVSSSVVDALAARNSWSAETRAISRLAMSAVIWLTGAGAALRTIGLSWAALAASMGVTTIGIGLASNNIFATVVHGADVLLSNTFKVGDRIKLGALQGVVEDMTLNHVVVKLDTEKYALVPHTLVRDSLLVVQPGTNP
jgi:small-conductance mechanosensitive channel